MSDLSVEVQCAIHGKSYATFVCQHLARGSGLGFYSADDATGSDPCPDAWCNECDRAMMQTGEWTEEAEAFARITLLCAGCYQMVKRRNQKP